MRKIIYISIIFILAVSNYSCKKFLEESSQDEIVPTTVQDLGYLMSGEGYPYQVDLNTLVNMLSDDVMCNGGQGQTNFVPVTRYGKAPYSWTKTMFEDVITMEMTAKEVANPWQLFYEQISACNVVLDHVDKVSGSQQERQHLKGEALAMRGFYYFYLVNLFGKPYAAHGSNPNKDLAVPLKLNMAVTDKLQLRNTVAEVYQQIEADLLEAKQLMEVNPRDAGVYKMSPLAVDVLLSRVYLYQNRWDEAIEFATKGLTIKSTLSQLSGFAKTPGYYNFNNGLGDDYNRMYDPSISTEIVFAYKAMGAGVGSSKLFPSSIYPGYSATLKPPYAPADGLMSLYDTRPMSSNNSYIGDIRPRLYFAYSAYFDWSTFQAGFLPFNGGQGGAGIRIAELYLNRAEALTQRVLLNGNAADRIAALNDLNTLRSARYDTRQTYVPVAIGDARELLAFCREERRREFPFEGHRWFDLRRYGMPALARTYSEESGNNQTFSLTVSDPRYTLPIPKAVLDRNGLLTQNP